MYKTKQGFLQGGGREGGGGQVLYLVELLGFNSVFGISFLSVLDGSLLLHLLQLFVESVGTRKHDYPCSQTCTANMIRQGKKRKDNVKLPLSSLVHF